MSRRSPNSSFDLRHRSFCVALNAVSLLLLSLALSACTHTTTYPAASAKLTGATRLAAPEPATATTPALPERLTNFTLPTDAALFTIRAPAPGDYFLELTYSAATGKRLPASVNGSFQGSVLLPATTGFQRHRYGRITLIAGDNLIRLGTDWGYTDITELHLTPASSPRPFRLSASPVNPHASPEARALFTTLTATFGRRTFAGQHDSNPLAPSRIAHLTRLTGGPRPALLGLDLLYYSGTWNQPQGDGAIGEALDWSRTHHGLVTLSWHWLAPLHPSPLIWDSFSTNKTSFDLTRLDDENSPEYAAVIRDLDRVAAQLARLRDAHVPVLWRPLHEAQGGWFWWGAHGPEATLRLYRIMFDRFTRVHHLENLLWVWTSTDDDNARDWYPGDDYVDIVATDLYAPAGTHGDYFTTFDRLRTLYRGRKPLALGECGVIPTLTARAPWLWFLTWDDLITRPEFNAPADLFRTFADPRLITLPSM